MVSAASPVARPVRSLVAFEAASLSISFPEVSFLAALIAFLNELKSGKQAQARVARIGPRACSTEHCSATHPGGAKNRL